MKKPVMISDIAGFFVVETNSKTKSDHLQHAIPMRLASHSGLRGAWMLRAGGGTFQ
ncbi:MAG: hypothetical protein Q7T62_09525 [Undibacterium sp.]|nr:hypothetical protein [Undibacterium sp.]